MSKMIKHVPAGGPLLAQQETMTSEPLGGELVQTTTAWRAALGRLAVADRPAFFQLQARLPLQGRTNQVVAASPMLSVVLKTYASGGENGLHGHPNEDHFFLVLQGAATFYGPRGEERVVRRNGGVMLPRGALYRFVAHEQEPLVLLRVGAALDPERDPLDRVDAHGAPFDGASEGNMEMPLVLSDNDWFL